MIRFCIALILFASRRHNRDLDRNEIKYIEQRKSTTATIRYPPRPTTHDYRPNQWNSLRRELFCVRVSHTEQHKHIRVFGKHTRLTIQFSSSTSLTWFAFRRAQCSGERTSERTNERANTARWRRRRTDELKPLYDENDDDNNEKCTCKVGDEGRGGLGALPSQEVG